MKIKTILFLIILAIFLTGCGKEEQPAEEVEVQQPEAQEPTCESPNVLIGETCCLDENQNGVCDSEEPEEPTCTAPEVLINGECCVDEDENGICDSEEEEVNETVELEAQENTHVVEMSGLSFSPSQLTINVGDTIVWQHSDTYNNRQDIKHKITLQGVTISPILYKGDSWSYTFTEAGQYSFIDPIWVTRMNNGRITVTE